MKKVLSIIMATTLLLCLCACNNNPSDDYSSVEVEIIYEDGTGSMYVDENGEVTSNIPGTTSSQNTGTTSKPGVSSPDNTSKENKYYLNDANTLKNIKFNGRCVETTAGVSLNHAASAIEFNTNSSSVMLELDATAGTYYTVMIDGQITEQHLAVENSGKNYIIVARRLSSGTHNIKFIRDGESRANVTFTAVSIQLDDGATLLAKDGNKKVIEFLGDSLTSGFGNLAVNGVLNASELKYMSSTKAYPFLLANKLGYDYRIVSMSSIALGKREGYPTFPEFYNLESYHIDKTAKYTSSNPQNVDVVVINLGTNDIGAGLYDAKNPQNIVAYEQHFTDLVTNIGYRKDAKIVFVTGIWQKEPISAINGAIKKLNSMGYNNAYVVTLNEYKSGGGSHPSAKEHEEIAGVLMNFFKKNGIA